LLLFLLSLQVFEFTIHAFPRGMTLRARSHGEVDAWVSDSARPRVPAQLRGVARARRALSLTCSHLLPPATPQLAALMKPLADADVPYNGWKRRGGAAAAGAGGR